jgi:DNA polymerase I-like protein with 3'-5' exonuclease and polymerase domains
MKTLTIDAETKDPYIGEGLGAGWCYPGDKFKVLGLSVKHDDGETKYVLPVGGNPDYSEYSTLLDHLDPVNTEDKYIIMHNASYDLGCLIKLGTDIRHLNIIDTEVMGRLFDSSHMSYALDALAKKYLKHKKDNQGLVEAIREAELVPYTQKHHTLLTKYCKTDDEEVKAQLRLEIDKSDKLWETRALKWAKSNMDLMQEHCYEAVEKYANMDVDLTYQLFKYYLDNCESRGWDKEEFLALTVKYSNVSKITCSYRQRGVRVDLKRCREIIQELRPMIAGLYKEVYELADEEFNLKSPKDMPRIFDKLNISYPKTEAGNASITSPWMEQQDHPICKAIVKARKYKNINDNFIQKILDMQTWTLDKEQEEVDNLEYGMVYPELNLLRARTGRFSCSSPNLQQIPSRDEYLAPMCRSIFVAHNNELIYSLDYSNQEGRLQVHYAFKLNCEGAGLLVEEFKHNPSFDMHQKVADMVGVSRTEAKAINLGISYGMGVAKLGKQLEIDEFQAKELREKYNDLAPFLTQLNRTCIDTMKRRKYIKTLGGRRSSADQPFYKNGEKITFEYKALNKLIQGSAADQTIEAMIQAYEAGIPVLFPVHDQFLISGERKHAETLQKIMESAILLEIPVVVDVDLDGGFRWSEAGH